MAIPLSYNVRHVFQKPIPTLATAVGVGLTVAIFIGAFALASGFQAALKATGSPDNVILLRKGADSEISSGIGLEAARVLLAMPQVALSPDGGPLASAEVLVVAMLDRLGMPGGANVPVRGVDAAGLALRDGVKIIEGTMFHDGADEVIVGKHLPERFQGCKVGDRVKLGARDVAIVGRFEANGSAFESEIWGDARVLMPLFRGEVYQSVTVRMKDPSQFDAWKEEVGRDPRLQLDAQRESEFYSKQSELLANVIRGAGIFITAIMAIGAIFGAMNTMFAAVGSRTKEIATLLILGFPPWSILFSFMVESLLIALLGGVLGCVFAIPINGITTSTTNWASFSEVAFAFQVTPVAMALGMAYSLAMGFVGGLLPAWRASRQGLATSLRDA